MIAQSLLGWLDAGSVSIASQTNLATIIAQYIYHTLEFLAVDFVVRERWKMNPYKSKNFCMIMEQHFDEGMAEGFVKGAESMIAPLGEWIKNEEGDNFFCTNCGKTPLDNWMTQEGIIILPNVPYEFTYCPKCGAYMIYK